MAYWHYPRISAETVRKVRAKCGQHQRQFAKRFDVSTRTVIRWEKSGTEYHWWGGSRSKIWKALVKKYPRAFTKEEREAIRR